MQTPLQEQTPSLAGQSLRVLVWDRDLVDMWCLDGRGQRVPFRGKGSTWHFHDDLELTLVTGGGGVLSVGDHIGRFTAPDCVLLGEDLPHVWRSRGRTAGMSLQFQRAAIAALPELGELDALWARARRGLRWSGPTAERLRRQVARMEGLPALQRLALFIDLVAIMREGAERDARELSAAAVTPGGATRGHRMDRVVDHIMRHYRQDLRLSDLVRLSGASQATFCRRFARATGKTFTAYLNAVRLQEARRALLESERSVTDIALSAGFNNLSHFHAIFRREVGCTPREYRRGDSP
jgi:AraC-like DNA-binding protein